MKQFYSPKEEVLDFMNDFLRTGRKGRKIQRGSECLTSQEFIQEMIMGTVQGKRAYSASEWVYQAYKEINTESSIDLNTFCRALKSYIKKYE